MSVMDKLQGMMVNESIGIDSTVILSYSDGVEVFLHNDTALERAIAETNTLNVFSQLVATPGLQTKDVAGEDIIHVLRELQLLNEDSSTQDLIDSIAANFYDQEFIEEVTEQYDSKRGFCSLEATVLVSMSDLLKIRPSIENWTVSVQTNQGTLTLD